MFYKISNEDEIFKGFMDEFSSRASSIHTKITSKELAEYREKR